MCKFIKYYAFNDRYECYYLNANSFYSDSMKIFDLDCSDLFVFLLITKSIFIPFIGEFLERLFIFFKLCLY
jgi:hypothetical protein